MNLSCPRQTDDEGTTLVELMVTMMLAVLILLVAGTFATQMLGFSTVNTARNANTAAAQTGMEYVTRALRSGDGTAFTSATDSDAQFSTYATTGGVAAAPVRIHFWVDTTGTPARLLQQTTNTSTGVSSPVRAIVTGWVACTTSTGTPLPLFTYTNSAGAPVTTATSAGTAYVRVQLCAQPQTAARPAAVDATVRLPNANL
ncbi:hypothetical protein CLV35_1453 [Motilibacter peucedani]|uniref:Uncharacterized protein n=1 Tax=Motilibacter peucedani TaxID=598650 RepID=A0A420XS87_9ACTN|nr:hypothetical protein [Motilibacter peucedani]RKS77755.1 hypothetical protein CLV35_1453 [Motilibacter peucedani]